MRHRFATVSVLCAVPLAGAAVAGQGEVAAPKRPDAKVLAFFAAAQPTSMEDFLRSRRPPPLSPTLRAEIIASLPRDGELQPSPAEQRKLAALDPVLDLHGRKGVVVVKVIEVGHAFVGLHARTVLLLSRDALALVTPEELQALAAHELAHEYSWDEYQAAMRLKAHERMQEMELMCDGLAVIALRALGLDPASLVSAVTKVTRYNERVGAIATAGSYVSLRDRRRFIEAVARLVGACEPAPAERKTAFGEAPRP